MSTPARVYAAASSSLNFQARLSSGTGAIVADGNYSLQFNLYSSASGGTSEWSETQSTVRVVNGYLTVNLGSVSAFPSTIDWSQQQWLTMNVNGDGEMNPRLLLTAVPYAFRAGQSDTLTNGSGTIGAANLAQLSPSALQTISSTLAALRINQTGSGSLLQLQQGGSDVFTVAGNGALTASSATLPLVTGSSGLSLLTSNSATASTGNITLKSGDASTGLNLSAGTLTIDTGTKTGTGSGLIYLGSTNATNVTIGNSGSALSLNGSSLTLGGGLSVISRAAAGATTFNLTDTADTTLVLTNSGTGAANLNIAEGGLQTAGTLRLTNGGALQNIAGLSIISGGATVSGNMSVSSGTFSSVGGLISLNDSSNFATNINTGTSTGTVTIGGGNAPLVIDSTNFDVSSGGALSGITGYSQNSGSFAFTSASSSGSLFTLNENSLTTGTGLSLSATGLTSGKGLAIVGGSAVTTGSDADFNGATYIHSTAETGSLVKVGFTDASTLASGNSVTSGINVASTLNTSGAGTKEIDGVNVAAPTLTACATGACTWNGLQATTQANSNSLVTQNGINIQTSGTSTAGTINALNIGNVTSGGASETAIKVGTGWDYAIDASGSGAWRGAVAERAQDSFTTNTTTTITTPVGLGYRLSNNAGTVMANVTATYNFTTGIQEVDGVFYIFAAQAQKATTTLAEQSTVIIQINGNTVGSVATSSTTVGQSRFKNFMVIRIGGTWRSLGSAQNTTDAADLAERFPYSGEQPNAGELVSVTEHEVAVSKTTPSSSNRVIGIVSTEPNLEIGPQSQPVAVAMAGRVPAVVSTINGNFSAGDSITASALTGEGMKQTGPGQSVGKALESFDPASRDCRDVNRVDDIVWPEDDGTNPAKPCFKVPVISFDQATRDTLKARYNLGDKDYIYIGKVMTLVNLSYADPNGVTEQMSRGNFQNLNVSSGIATQGLTVRGNALLARVTVEGTATFKGNVVVEGHIQGNGDTRGQLMIQAGQAMGEYHFGRAFDKPPNVVATPTGNPGGSFWIGAVDNRSFRLYLDHPAASSISFNFQVQQ